jgi:hypothetical protein
MKARVIVEFELHSFFTSTIDSVVNYTPLPIYPLEKMSLISTEE